MCFQGGEGVIQGLFSQKIGTTLYANFRGKKILSELEVCVFALVPGSFFAVGLHEAFFLILPLCPSPPYIFFKEWGIA